ncbi:MAG TPA: single-stranded-DNA-specific exonuclease RecJ, partial [Clostridia bacterium]|nr:single-stranded-DNA-specific exonuclease RecJ [Clostridia bacterium]
MSVRNKLWKIKPNNIQIEKIKQYDPLLNQLLINRGIIDFSARKKFLDTSLFDLHDPYKLLDMDKAVNRIKNAIKQKQKILVYGDYDVDGITSTVILLKVIEELGGIAEYYIPDRHKEGYGLNKDALLWAAQSGFELIITVDCGISAVNEASFASELGLDLVITDHHEAEYTVPDAVAVINPKRIDCNYPFKYLAGVGVAFKLAQALWHFTGKSEHFLCDLLCLVALGTVADVVPLIDENRIFVKYGLELMNEQVSNLGLKKLLECAGYQGDKIDCYVLAYILAPRMNAIGRLDHANWAVKLLLEKDEQTAANLAEKLNEANRIRQKIENDILAEAEEQIIRYNWDKDKVLVIASSNWNPGVIGIVASRLMEKYYKPVIMIALEGEIGKGSGRSISKFNLYQALKNCQDLLVKFGGHSAAAGLTIEIDRIEEFRIRINHYADQVLEPEAMLPELDIDLELNSRDISFELVEKIEKLAPFGCGNPIPLFLLRNISVQKCMQMGKDKDHLKLVFSDGNLLLEGVFFKQGSFAEIIKQGDRVSVVFRLSINNWNGERKVQLLIEDLEIHSYVSPFPAINSLIRTNLPVIDMDDLSQSKGLLFLNEIQKKLVEFISKEKKPIFLSVRSNFYGTELLEKTLNIFSYWGIKIAI